MTDSPKPRGPIRGSLKFISWFPGIERELAVLDDEPAQRKARRHVMRGLMRRVRVWLLFVGGIALMGVAAVPVSRLYMRSPWQPISPWLIGPLFGGVYGGLFSILWLWLCRRTSRRLLREYLCAQGVPVCLYCGYNLTGQTEARCPECGRPMEMPKASGR